MARSRLPNLCVHCTLYYVLFLFSKGILLYKLFVASTYTTMYFLYNQQYNIHIISANLNKSILNSTPFSFQYCTIYKVRIWSILKARQIAALFLMVYFFSVIFPFFFPSAYYTNIYLIAYNTKRSRIIYRYVKSNYKIYLIILWRSFTTFI